MNARRAVPFVVAALAAAAPAQESPVLERLKAAVKDGPIAVAHRGASEDFPENTVVALRAAVAAKAAVVEFDVWQTKDGAWVLMHDATCDRTTDAKAKFGQGEVRVDGLTLVQARVLDAGKWKGERFAGEKVPTMAEALAATGPATPMIERKGGDAAAFVAELRRLDAVDQVIVQSFDWDWLAAVHRAEPKLLIAALGDKQPIRERLGDVQRTGASIVHWDHRMLDLDAAAKVHEAGHLLCTYTVDPDVLLLGAAAIGCDLITTNRPARLVELRSRGLLPQTVQGHQSR